MSDVLYCVVLCVYSHTLHTCGKRRKTASAKCQTVKRCRLSESMMYCMVLNVYPYTLYSYIYKNPIFLYIYTLYSYTLYSFLHPIFLYIYTLYSYTLYSIFFFLHPMYLYIYTLYSYTLYSIFLHPTHPLQHTATHCNTLRFNAKHCNTRPDFRMYSLTPYTPMAGVARPHPRDVKRQRYTQNPFEHSGTGVCVCDMYVHVYMYIYIYIHTCIYTYNICV